LWASATPPRSWRRIANPERREREQPVAHGRIVELAQARQVPIGHAAALLRDFPIEPVDLLAVGIREIDAVSG
jgi:hypothetical protein